MISAGRDGVLLRVRVQPRAARERIVGEQGGALKITLGAPPLDGAANQACLKLLARCFGLPKSCLRISSGHKSREKRILLTGISLQRAREILEEILVNG